MEEEAGEEIKKEHKEDKEEEEGDEVEKVGEGEEEEEQEQGAEAANMELSEYTPEMLSILGAAPNCIVRMIQISHMNP